MRISGNILSDGQTHKQTNRRGHHSTPLPHRQHTSNNNILTGGPTGPGGPCCPCGPGGPGTGAGVGGMGCESDVLAVKLTGAGSNTWLTRCDNETTVNQV